jgi:hypothetical protein
MAAIGRKLPVYWTTRCLPLGVKQTFVWVFVSIWLEDHRPLPGRRPKPSHFAKSQIPDTTAANSETDNFRIFITLKA